MTDSTPHYDDGASSIEGRYAALGLLDDEVVIYDRENDGAWIQSDRSIETVMMV